MGTFTAPAQLIDSGALNTSRQAIGDRSIVMLPLAVDSNAGLASSHLSADQGNGEVSVPQSLSKTAAESTRDVDRLLQPAANMKWPPQSIRKASRQRRQMITRMMLPTVTSKASTRMPIHN